MGRVCKFFIKTSFVTTLVLGILALPSQGQVTPVFHLNFSTDTDASDFADVSGNNLAITVDTNTVSYVPGGGPTLGGVVVDSAEWTGDMFEDNEIRILQNPTLDAVSRGAGSIVAWVNPDDGDTWNNITKTLNGFDGVTEFNGVEFQASGLGGNADSGAFGAVQGWKNNVFGPIKPILQDPIVSDTPTGVWTHLALTWNESGDSLIYVNGVPGSEKVLANTVFGSNTSSDWTIGGDPQNKFFLSAERLLDGQMADFAIFDERLSLVQIEDIMTGGVASLAAPSFSADFNGDGGVDGADLRDWEGAFGVNASADADGDGDSDGADLLEWQRQLGNGLAVSSAVAAVPEPSSLILCGLAALLLWRDPRSQE